MSNTQTPVSDFQVSEFDDDSSGRPWAFGGVVSWSSLFFAILQSVCTFFAALGGLRLVISATALAAATEDGVFWDRFHSDAIRIPMIVIALAGALLNLVVLRRVWRLRKRPASQWRRIQIAPRKILGERLQFATALLTLVLLAVEESTHFFYFHHF